MKHWTLTSALVLTCICTQAQIDTTRTLDSLLLTYVESWDPSGLAVLKPNTLKPGEAFGIYQSYFPSDQDNQLVLIGQETDDLIGHTHYRYQQHYKDIPVEGAEFFEHAQGGYLVYANGKLAFMDQDTTGAMNKLEAMDSLANAHDQWGIGYEWAWLDAEWEQALKDESGNQDTSYFPYANGQLVWALWNYTKLDYFIPDSCLRLAWRFEVHCLDPHFFKAYYVDAFNGEIFTTEDLVCTNGPATIPIYGSVVLNTKARGWPHHDFVLHDDDNNRNIHTKYYYGEANTTQRIDNGLHFSVASEITDDNDAWDTTDQRAQSVHWMATRTWLYFEEQHGYEGLNGNGSKLKVRADGPHLNEKTYYKNNKLVISSTDDHRWLGVLDVVAHEYTHGITAHSAKLKYEKEPGALNESFSDIFGALAERYTEALLGGFTPDYHMGEDLSFNLPLRALDTPGQAGFHYNPNIVPCENAIELGQPDTYEGDRWYFENDREENDQCDNYGVHVNSGVQNKWFTLLAEGGAHNGVSVVGIGADDAAQIAFYTLTHILGKHSEYDDARSASTFAGLLLFGPCSVQRQSVSDAWDAVQVPGTPVECFPQGINAAREVALHLRAYPNPTRSQVTLKADRELRGRLDMFSASGALLGQQQVSGTAVVKLLLPFPPGIYFLRFTDVSGQVHIKKIHLL